MGDRLRELWAWSRVPLGWAVGSRVAVELLAVMGLMWIGPAKPIVLPGRPFLDPWFRWDANWYLQIAQAGYSMAEPEPGQRNTFFFPLFPLLARAVGRVLGGDVPLGAVVVANGCFVAAVVVLYRFVQERWDAEVAERTVALLCAAPHAFFFSAAYAESVFFLCWVSAVFFAQRRLWWAAGLAVALSGAARGVGPILLSGLGLMALEQAGWRWRALDKRVAFLAVGPLGLGAYLAFLDRAFGSPWLFTGATGIRGWGAGHSMGKMWGALFEWTGGLAPIADLSHVVLLTLASAVVLLAWRRVGHSLSVFAALTMGVYWSVWYSASRYLVVLFPLFIGVALLTRERPRALLAVGAASLLAQGMFLYLFTHWEWVS